MGFNLGRDGNAAVLMRAFMRVASPGRGSQDPSNQNTDTGTGKSLSSATTSENEERL